MCSIHRTDAKFWNMVAKSERDGEVLYPPISRSFFQPDCAPYVNLNYLKLSKMSTVAELGCGNGIILHEVAKQVYKAVGVDFSDEQLRNARLRLSNECNVRLTKYDLNKGLPYYMQKTDIIYSIYGALDFVKNPFQLIKDCWESINPNGHLVILTSKLPLKEVQDYLINSHIQDYISVSGNHEVARFCKIKKGS